jgi:hypothetical protein
LDIKLAGKLYQGLHKTFPKAVTWLTNEAVGLQIEDLDFVFHHPHPSYPQWRRIGPYSVFYTSRQSASQEKEKDILNLVAGVAQKALTKSASVV